MGDFLFGACVLGVEATKEGVFKIQRDSHEKLINIAY